MAVVFISYERSTEAIARQVVAALERAGHQPWSDALLPPHRDYSLVIEERLQSADVVLVLWSKTGAASQWVRAEADYARGREKLVQVSLDETVPPMPFNQIHFASLVNWRGSTDDREWQKVLASISQLADGVAPTIVDGHASRGRPIHMRPLAWLIAGVAAAFILAGGLWFGRGILARAPSPAALRVAILPLDALSASPDARFFADGLADKIVTVLSDNHIQVVSHDDAATLRGPDRDQRVAELGIGLVLDGSVKNDGKIITASVHLDDPTQHVTVWSGGAEGPADHGDQLQAQLANTIVSVLACSRRALVPSHGLTDPALLARYLHACDVVANRPNGDQRNIIDLMASMRQVTAGAPDYEPAHSEFAMYASILSGSLPPDQATPLRREAATEAARALALNPNSPDALVAQGYLLPPLHLAETETLFRKAVAADPDGPNANGALAGLLGATGRMHEAVQAAEKAASADLEIDWSLMASSFAGMDGQPARCVDDLTHTLFLRPKDGSVWNFLFNCLQAAGRWDDAAKLAADTPNRPPETGTTNPAEVAFLTAAKTRAPADLAKARVLLQPLPGEPAYVLILRMQGLSELGFVDDAFVLANRWVDAGGTADAVFFFPHQAPMRRDPRFISLMARLGLVDFWRTSGHWPDFCSDPTLPYDCKAIASRLPVGAAH